MMPGMVRLGYVAASWLREFSTRPSPRALLPLRSASQALIDILFCSLGCLLRSDLDRMREVRFMGSRYYADEVDSKGKVVRPVGSAIWKGTYTTGESGKIEDNVGGDQGFFYPIKQVHPEVSCTVFLSRERRVELFADSNSSSLARSTSDVHGFVISPDKLLSPSKLTVLPLRSSTFLGNHLLHSNFLRDRSGHQRRT